MGTLEFHLFRAKFIRSQQKLLFHPETTPSELFRKAIDERPSLKLGQGHIWHVGNVEPIGEAAGYFAVGRTTKSIIEKYDDVQKNFVEEIYEESPYTHVLFDSTLGLLAIARKARLAPTVNGIARKMQMLFDNTKVASDFEVTVEIDFLRDPDSFVKILSQAYAIKKFTATFGGPNPFDADEMFQKPLSVYLQSANGRKGKATVEGEDLSIDTLKRVTVSVAATGNNASARLQKKKGGRPTTAYLGENQVVSSVKEEDFDKPTVLEDIKEKYRTVREA